MKALSLWQPWASAMERGGKAIETRSWYTSYRGDVVICSSLKKPGIELWTELGQLSYEDALALPYGCALCLVDLVEVIPTDVFNGPNAVFISRSEREFGDYTTGRWAWITKGLRRLKRPVPIRGHRGLWNLKEPELGAILSMLP